MKAKDIRELTVEDIQAKLAEEKENYSKASITHNTAPLESPIELRKQRRLIARLSTILTEKQQA